MSFVSLKVTTFLHRTARGNVNAPLLLTVHWDRGSMLLSGMSVDSGSGEDLPVSLNVYMCTVLYPISDFTDGDP